MSVNACKRPLCFDCVSSPRLASCDAGQKARLRLLTVSHRDRGRRDRDAFVHDHDRANGRCRGPHCPNVLRAIPSLRGSGRSADASSMLLRTEDAPNVRAPTCNRDPPVSNILRAKKSPCPAAAQVPRRRSLVAESRCTPKSAPSSARSRLRAVRQRSSPISFSVSSLEIPLTPSKFL